MVLKRTSHSNDTKEWAIIYQIYTLIPQDKKARYDELVPKLEAEQLSTDERKEFMELNEEMENFSVEHLKLLIELAKIRKTSLPTVILQLGLQKF